MPSEKVEQQTHYILIFNLLF